MGLFWDKKIESDRTIYTRSKKQKRIFFTLATLGFVVFLGLPGLMLWVHFLGELFVSSLAWAVFFIALRWTGVVLWLAVLIFGGMHAILMSAQSKKKRTHITYSSEGDTIVIYND